VRDGRGWEGAEGLRDGSWQVDEFGGVEERVAEIGPDGDGIGVDAAEFGEGFAAGQDLVRSRTAGEGGFEEPGDAGLVGVWGGAEQAFGPDACLLMDEGIVHEGEGLARDIGPVAPAHGAEGGGEIEGDQERRHEVASDGGVEAAPTRTVEGAILFGSTAAIGELGEVNGDGRAAGGGVETS